jgi:hypothetical protein
LDDIFSSDAAGPHTEYEWVRELKLVKHESSSEEGGTQTGKRDVVSALALDLHMQKLTVCGL